MKFTPNLILILSCLFFTPKVWGQSTKFSPYHNAFQKQKEKYKDRWTLASWFETERKVRLMDQWLATNSSSNPYELFIGGDFTHFDRTISSDTEQKFKIWRAYMATYASIIGIEGGYESTSEETKSWYGQGNLRILGRAAQSTNLTLFYGVKNRIEKDNLTEEEFSNQYAGASMSLYITKYFGIEGLYRSYLEDESDMQTKLKGTRTEGSFFIDYNIARPYATWFKEDLEYTTSGSKMEHKSVGILMGLRVYF